MFFVLCLATQSPTKFNCRLTTSTPTLPPQNSLSPSHMPLTTSRDIHKEGAQQGGITYFPVHISPAPLPTVLQVPLHIASQAAVAQVIPHAPCPNEGGLQQGNTRDQDLLRQIQMHLSHLQHHQVEGWQPVVSSQVQDPTQTQASAELSESEHSEWTTSEDELDSVDHTPVRDTSCQTSFDKQNLLRMKSASPDQTMKKVQTVKYLLGELKALVAEKGDDPEVFRVITEVEDNISLLPTMVGSTNVQAEIALALQPLRSENAQLRRRLRIVNQQLRERERAEKELNPLDVNFELISVQSLNMTLQAQLKESNKSIELLQKKCEELLKAVDEQKVQNQELLNTIQNKEGEIMLIRQQCDSDINSIKTDIEEALSKMKNIQFQLETSEKENQVLKLNLQQRDAEVTRLHELTRNVQESMVRLISELGVDNNKLKTASRLTQTLLEQFESQPIEDPALNPVRGMVKKYFDTLMVEHHSSLQTDEGFSDKLDVGSLENFNHGSKPSLSNSKENDFAVLTARTSPSREFTSKFLSEFEHKGSVSLNERGKVHEAAHFPVFGPLEQAEGLLYLRTCSDPAMGKVVTRWVGYFGQLFKADPPARTLDISGSSVLGADPPISCEPPKLGGRLQGSVVSMVNFSRLVARLSSWHSKQSLLPFGRLASSQLTGKQDLSSLSVKGRVIATWIAATTGG
ncbi:CCD14 protein, partial [Polypterus senegalus]